jgi:hypothetical protein
MEEDEPPDPAHIGFLGADGVVLGPGFLAYLVEKLGRLGLGHEVLLDAWSFACRARPLPLSASMPGFSQGVPPRGRTGCAGARKNTKPLGRGHPENFSSRRATAEGVEGSDEEEMCSLSAKRRMLPETVQSGMASCQAQKTHTSCVTPLTQHSWTWASRSPEEPRRQKRRDWTWLEFMR